MTVKRLVSAGSWIGFTSLGGTALARMISGSVFGSAGDRALNAAGSMPFVIGALIAAVVAGIMLAMSRDAEEKDIITYVGLAHCFTLFALAAFAFVPFLPPLTPSGHAFAVALQSVLAALALACMYAAATKARESEAVFTGSTLAFLATSVPGFGPVYGILHFEPRSS